jgi:hypothetical protein
MSKAKKPPASYSIPSFRTGDYASVPEQLDKLATMGFKWVTFTPTYEVKEVKHTANSDLNDVFNPFVRLWRFLFGQPTITLHYLELNDGQTPLAELKKAILSAIKKGFNVKIEPHLDWASTLSGTSEKDWRMTMYFDPVDAKTLSGSYEEKIITPILNIIEEAEKITRPSGANKPCYALTLGSELDVSLYAFVSGWEEMKTRAQRRRKSLGLENPRRLSIGHKLNYDVFDTNGALRRHMPNVRAEWNEPKVTPKEWQLWGQAIMGYLRDLDYASFSFYPPIAHLVPSGFDWTKDSDPASHEKIAEIFKDHAKALRDKLGKKVPLDVGEFGLGSTDLSEPYGDHPEEFVTPDGSSFKTNHDAQAKRRLYIKAMAKFMADNKSWFEAVGKTDCCNYLPATFWTVKHYDFLGIWDYDIQVGPKSEEGQIPTAKHELFVDEQLIEYLKKCNQRTYE